MQLIKTSDLGNWARSVVAQSRFPHLVKSLIYETIDSKNLKIRMPSDDAIWLPGLDGVAVCAEENIFVPMGKSVWELGTDSNYENKANNDYKKRSVGDSGFLKGFTRAEVTFVFVTPHLWKEPNKTKWIQKHKEDNVWKDVKVVDGVELQDWIEKCPVANLQLCKELGYLSESGVKTAEQAWSGWSKLTKPEMIEEVVLAGRTQQVDELIFFLSQQCDIVAVCGDSLREVWGFVLAAIRTISVIEDREKLLARTIVFDNEEIAGRTNHLNNHIIILKNTVGQVSGALSEQNHVIISAGNPRNIKGKIIELARPYHNEFVTALKKMNYQEAEAEKKSRECGLSVSVLHRLIAHANALEAPWALSSNVKGLIPAILAGCWSEQSELDCAIISKLADTKVYEEAISRIQPFLNIEETPLRKINEMWMLTAPVDAFLQVAHLITSSHLTRFKESFQEVFGAVDPRVEMSPDDWIYIAINDPKRHSEWLRRGLSETLLLIAERGSDAKMQCFLSGENPQTYADRVVRDLPGLNNDWRVLASIRDQYSRLMEAAPRPLLESLETLLEAKPEDMKKLFVEGKSALSGGGMHTGILWGLELMAWDPDYLLRVSMILARLAQIDPGGRLSNRPINSLREIFLWWHPGTNASVRQKLDILDSIIACIPSVGWELVSKLLPGSGGQLISHLTNRPRWRDVGEPEDSARKNKEYLSEIVFRTLGQAGNDANRWDIILKSFQSFDPKAKDRCVALLENVVNDAERTLADKLLFWEVLRKHINRNKTYSDAKWALSNDDLKRLEKIMSLSEPKDLIEKNKWLFDDWMPDLPLIESNIEARQEKVQKCREEAIQEIYRTLGIDGILKLGELCQYPEWVANIAVNVFSRIDEARVYLEKEMGADRQELRIASRISQAAYQRFGNAWVELIEDMASRQKMEAPAVASLIIFWTENKAVWAFAERMGGNVETEYWRQKPIFALVGDVEAQVYQINKLMAVGRAAETFDRIALNIKDLPSVILLNLFTAAFEEIGRMQTADELKKSGMNAYDLVTYIKQLRSRADISKVEIMRCEYSALPFLYAEEDEGLILHETMAESADFFVEVLTDAFMPANSDSEEEKQVSAGSVARARAAWTLLNNMHTMPGMTNSDQIDEKTLWDWICNVRDKAESVGRQYVAESEIGKLLAHAPVDPEDGGWPHRVIRNILEKAKSTSLEHGLIIERCNMRGVTTRGLFEGGRQEEELAAEYRVWAGIARSKWQKTTEVLEALACNYDKDAQCADVRAEQNRIKFDG